MDAQSVLNVLLFFPTFFPLCLPSVSADLFVSSPLLSSLWSAADWEWELIRLSVGSAVTSTPHKRRHTTHRTHKEKKGLIQTGEDKG